MQEIKDRIKNLRNKTNTNKNNKNKKTNTTKKKPTVLSKIKSSIKKQVNPSTQTLKARETREGIKANIAKNKVIQKNPEKFKQYSKKYRCHNRKTQKNKFKTSTF